MKLTGDYLFEAPVQEVWDALMDPVVLAAVMPGCEKLDLVDGQYVGELNIKVGPVQGKFTGKVDLKDVVAPKSYTMVVDGRGAPGFVKATATVKLEKEGEGTKLTYDADAQIGGKIASIGQRLIDASAKAITKQSLEGLHANIKVRHEAALADAAEAAALAKEAEPPPPAVVAKVEEQAAAKAEEATEKAAAADEAIEPAPESAEVIGVESLRGEAIAAARPKSTPPPVPKKKAPPPVVKASQAAFAASVAKEVSKSLIPPPVMYGLIAAVIVLVAWLVSR